MNYTIFKTCFKTEAGWKTEYIFYCGSLGWNTNTSTDWRFREIEGVRKKADLMGYADIELPAQYPIVLNDGKLLPDLKEDVNVIVQNFNFKPIKPNINKYIPHYKTFAMVEPKHYDSEGKDTCYYCDKKIEGNTLTRDHAYPKSLGFGLKNNRVNSCHTCNNFKSNLTPEEFVKHIEFNIEFLSKMKERAMKLISKDKDKIINHHSK